MYINAQEVLPRDLLRQVQRYVQGREIYIPKDSRHRLGWGERNGARRELARRNREIATRHARGESVEALSEEYHLSYDSIRKIVRGNRKSRP